jgi:hypothetical protein
LGRKAAVRIMGDYGKRDPFSYLQDKADHSFHSPCYASNSYEMVCARLMAAPFRVALLAEPTDVWKFQHGAADVESKNTAEKG